MQVLRERPVRGEALSIDTILLAMLFCRPGRKVKQKHREGIHRTKEGSFSDLPDSLVGQRQHPLNGGGLLNLPARFALTDSHVFCLH